MGDGRWLMARTGDAAGEKNGKDGRNGSEGRGDVQWSQCIYALYIKNESYKYRHVLKHRYNISELVVDSP